MKYLKRPDPQAAGRPSAAIEPAGEWPVLYPALCEFLAADHWDDGAVRTPGSLTFFCEEGQWKLCLSDRDAQRVAFVSGRSPEEVLTTAERGLVEQRLDWRLQGARGKGKAK